MKEEELKKEIEAIKQLKEFNKLEKYEQEFLIGVFEKGFLAGQLSSTERCLKMIEEIEIEYQNKWKDLKYKNKIKAIELLQKQWKCFKQKIKEMK